MEKEGKNFALYNILSLGFEPVFSRISNARSYDGQIVECPGVNDCEQADEN